MHTDLDASMGVHPLPEVPTGMAAPDGRALIAVVVSLNQGDKDLAAEELVESRRFHDIQNGVGEGLVLFDKQVKTIEHERTSSGWPEWIVSKPVIEGVQIAIPGAVAELLLPI